MQEQQRDQVNIVVYLDTETNFGDQPIGATTTQIGLHSLRLGLDLRLHNPKRSATQKLWLDAFAVLKALLPAAPCNTSSSSSPPPSSRYILIAHNGFAFDFMNMINELGGAASCMMIGEDDDDENREASLMRWVCSSGSVCFLDSMEIVMESFRSRGHKSPRSFSLDALYSAFIGSTSSSFMSMTGNSAHSNNNNNNNTFVGRHDALEDARMLRVVLDRMMIKEDALCALQPLGWPDLLVMHRSWRVREGLLKNPSRPPSVPRVFMVTSCVDSYSISLFKTKDAASFTAIVAPANADGKIRILSGNLEGRTQGLPARMRAWTSILRSVGKRGAVRQSKQLLSADSDGIELYADHPLLAVNTLWYKDPACILPDDVVHVKLIDPEADKIIVHLENHQVAVHSPSFPSSQQQQQRNDEHETLSINSFHNERKLSTNLLQAANELWQALDLLLRQDITHSWQPGTGECVSFI